MDAELEREPEDVRDRLRRGLGLDALGRLARSSREDGEAR
jgi:hypothetical protein